MGEFMVRGIRGAIQAETNTTEGINQATTELLRALVEANEITAENIASVFLTTTPDLDAKFSTYAGRDLGWKMVPLLCLRERDVSNSKPRLIRVLVHVNTIKSQDQMKHIYLGEAAVLRPDLADEK